MEVKLIELRDRATFMPMMAVKLESAEDREIYLLRRAGYDRDQVLEGSTQEPYIIFIKLDGVEAQYDPYQWATRARTVPEAHRYLIEHWSEVSSGDVIDVEFLLGEKPAPVQSEQITSRLW